MTAQTLTTNTLVKQAGIPEMATGKMVTDAGSATDETVYVGFKARYVKITNITDTITYEWTEGMDNPGGLKTAANGALSYSSTEAAGITVSDKATSNSGTSVSLVEDPGLHSSDSHTNVQGGLVGFGITFDEDIMVASKTFVWYALA